MSFVWTWIRDTIAPTTPTQESTESDAVIDRQDDQKKTEQPNHNESSLRRRINNMAASAVRHLTPILPRFVHTKVNEPEPVDVVFGGGGFAGLYMIGVIQYIRDHNVRIDRVYGVSVGSMIGAGLICGVPIDESLKVYDQVFFNGFWRRGGPLSVSVSARRYLDMLLPVDAHIHCSNRLFITINECSGNVLQMKRKLISHFQTRDELLDVITASTWIPGFTAPFKLFRRWDAHKNANISCMDGFLPIPPPKYRDRRMILVDPLAAPLRHWYHLAIAPDMVEIRRLIAEGRRDMEKGKGQIPQASHFVRGGLLCLIAGGVCISVILQQGWHLLKHVIPSKTKTTTKTKIKIKNKNKYKYKYK